MRRILFSIAIFLLSLTSVMGQKIPINLPADGNWPTIVGDSIMIIGPLQNELTEEQRYFNPVYMIVYPGKEHLQAQIIRAGLCDCDLTKPNRRIGVFSVAPDKKVSFSQGNLQYLPAINLWKFANTQYESLGNANKYLKPTFRNWVDLFGWSANNTTAPFGVSTSTNVADYAGDFVDWGTNTICGDAPGTWRMLSVDEWDYLINKRTNAKQLCGMACVHGANGLILLPDDWIAPTDIPFTSGTHDKDGSSYFAHVNDYTIEQWQRMEESGAVFLPTAGVIRKDDEIRVGSRASYWSSTGQGTKAYILNFHSNFIITYNEVRYAGRSVRLVHDTIVPETIPEPCLIVKVNDTLSINMMCVEGGTFMMGATDGNSTAGKNEFPQHSVTLSDYMIGQTEVTKGQWLSVMGEKPKKASTSWLTADPQTPANDVTWSECVEFAERLSQLTGQNFRLPTEAEWEFAARGGNRSRGFRYAGSDTIDHVAWYVHNYQQTTHPVATKLPNELGIYDMSGNVWEWCLDAPKDYKDYAQKDPLVAFVNNCRVIRGGAYEREEHRCTTTHRTTWLSAWKQKGANTGFRVVLNNNHVVHTLLLNDTVAFNMKFVEGEMYDYKIAQTEVTQGLWEQVMGYNNSLFKGEYLPVEKVSWEECQTFIQKLNEMTGKHFRLPTEAEWEYAARGGKNSRGYTYAGSNSIDSVAWYQSNSQEQTHTIATLMPNELGIYDMSGNVWEWCEDYYDTDETMHVVKSGSFYDIASTCRIDFRTARLADHKSYIGLRLVLDERSTPPEPEYVDLGLSVKWATFNVGATSPEDYGDYFAWGETEPKEVYSWATYKWGTSSKLTKYNATDGKTILDSEDDAAYVHWGGKWRMPSKEEVDELTQQCNWIWTTHNNVNGYKVTGPNGNSIFLPAAGYKGSGPTYPEGEDGLYWTNTIEKQHYSYLIVLHGDAPPTQAGRQGTRCFGFTIRPVYDDRPPKRIGVFSVAADKQVSFSQGNLQYVQSTDEWRFAREQYEYIGAANIKDGKLADKIDMFGWSADADPANKWGVTIAQEGFDGDFVDWGLNYIHGEAPGSWRTLSQDEWSYLLSCRQHATELWGVAQVAGVNGVIILPDRWSPTDDLPFVAGINENGYAAQQTLSVEQWQLMEELGAVFLPAAGGRDGASLAFSHIDSVGWYWLSTPTDPGKASCVRFECNLMVQRNGWRQAGLSVRLVHDTIVSKVEPEYVDLGLSVKWATFNVGATSPNEIGNFYAWGEIEPKDTYTVNNYKWWNESSKEITKYCTIDSLAYGDVADGLTELQPQDDIAHILKGEHWRMPNLDECKELVNGCTWTVSTRQGQIGFEGTSKINGNTIFLPVAGFRAGANLVYETLGGYWSSTLNIEKQSCAMGLYLSQETPAVNIYYNSNRQNGFLIRPVYDEVPDPCLVVKVNDTLSINLMCVEGGTFMMGSDAPDAQADEQPVHEVTLSDYYIGQTEVTQHLWKAVMGSGNNPSAVKGNNLPVTNITWDEAQVFVERLSELTGMRFRLPTEAEWEYAARGGQKSKRYTYAGSNDIDEVGWYNENSSNKTHDVGQKQPNELGIYDMTGNVWEYCSDWHIPYSAQAQSNPTGAATGDKHVLRGGCYHYDSKNCTNTNRHSYYTPDKGGASTGLRIVLEP